MVEQGKWDFWVDRGGTFTDLIARDETGRLVARKLLSSRPGLYDDPITYGILSHFELSPDSPLPIERIGSVKIGTTIATNALLERKGARVLLLTTRGHSSFLQIGDQDRPDIFALDIQKPEQLYERVVSLEERILADGAVELPLDEDSAWDILNTAYSDGIRSLAVCFLHAYAHPQHEQRVGEIAREIGFKRISLSHEISPLIKFVARGDTTVTDAYLSPLLRTYAKQLKKRLQPENDQAASARLLFMRSSGGLATANYFSGKDAVLSGPAGGVVGAARTASIAGFDKVIGFDMGGTSTDVCHYHGDYERSFDTVISGVRMRVPMLKVHTLAAGGGSLLHYDGGRLQVGPQSAGADPGPMSYRAGGPLTVTDANLLTGKLDPDSFPRLFGPDNDQPLDAAGVRAAFAELAKKLGDNRTPEEIADGFIRIAVENMANGIKTISVQQGYDVADYLLSCFGGAGGQHACLVADTLGISRILIHPLSGLLSAYGIGLSPLNATRQQSLTLQLTQDNMVELGKVQGQLENETRFELAEQGIDSAELRTATRYHLRYDNTNLALPVPADEPLAMKHAFEEAHQQRFGFISPERLIYVETIEAETEGGGVPADEPERALTPAPLPDGEDIRFFSQRQWHDARRYRREHLSSGHRITGPAILIEPNQTVVVEPGWQAEITKRDHLLLSRAKPLPAREFVGAEADPVMLEIFNNQFTSIAEQMGEALRNTARSVNIKERLDFSCALFDASGDMIANAPHIPVHLGSMDCSVRSLIEDSDGAFQRGDTYMLNAPYKGGTHLPDITVITPVFGQHVDQPLFFVASRGHHADIGGLSPGSMSPGAANIHQEGVYIDSFRLVSGNRFNEEAVLDLLTREDNPARNPQQNIADLKAQAAANEKGARELLKLCDHYGTDVVSAYMDHVKDNGEECVRRAIGRLRDGSFTASMDGGLQVSVAVKIDQGARQAHIDFSGTSPQDEGNFNAPLPVTRAAVLYVFRCLIDEDIPLNSGCLRPLTLSIPEGSLLSPAYPAAVVAGNVETSQVITNALFAALKALGSSQGTMNNLTFGDEELQYYETICSGAPAGPGFDGADAVHTHMTNSRLTDPEILEQRFPVVVERFQIQKDSGGKGEHSAGDGVLRRIRFLKPMRCAILSGFREVAPFGLEGGEDGQKGENWVRRANGKLQRLASCDETPLEAGDAVIIKTPTGGGYGKPK